MNLINPTIDSLPAFSPRLKLGILASGNGSNFENLVRSELQADIELLIVNNPSAKVIDRAKRLNIKYLILRHNDFPNREEYEKSIIDSFKSHNVEALIMAGWNRIVTSSLIKHYPNRIINIHPSLLPSFKGMNAVENALINKVKITGCTVHIVSEELDSGPILIQSAVPVLKTDSFHELFSRVQKEEHRIFPMGIALAAVKWRKV